MTEDPRFRSAYDPPHRRYPTEPGESRTKQSFKNECDINAIIDNYTSTGVLTHVSEVVGQYLDVSEIGDYRTALHNIREVSEQFMALPSGIRAEFQNDPAQFMDFLADPSNHDRAAELGLIQAVKTPPAQAALEPDPEPPAEPPKAVEIDND